MPFGILNLDKPAGWTSRQVVNRVQRCVRPDKVGHAGTLDPIATGVLVVCVGQATRLIEYVQRMPKTYRGQFLLGRSSPSDDVEGEVHVTEEAPRVSRDQIAGALGQFIGAIEQVPPAFSAIKLAGRRAYDLAREGKHVDIKPRKVEVHSIDLIQFESPLLEIEITCGGGTYVRALGRDLARAVGTTAVMSALRRTAIGSYTIDASCPAEDLDAERIEKHLTAPESALSGVPQQQLDDPTLERIANGLFVRLPDVEQDECAAMDSRGRLRAILIRRRNGEFGPARNFSANH